MHKPYIRTYIHTYTHTYILIYIHTYIYIGPITRVFNFLRWIYPLIQRAILVYQQPMGTLCLTFHGKLKCSKYITVPINRSREGSSYALCDASLPL